MARFRLPGVPWRQAQGVAGLATVAVATGVLAGPWWGVLEVGSGLLVAAAFDSFGGG